MKKTDPNPLPPKRPTHEAPLPLRPAIFLDRDGTLMEEVNYCADPAHVHLFPGTAAALRSLTQAGYLCIIITNQAGIGRGYFSETDYQAVQTELLCQLQRQETPSPHPFSPLITASYHCPDAPSTPSTRRKPAPGMVLEAARDWNLDLPRSWFIGDKRADIECGQHAGTRTILVQTGYGQQTATSGGPIPNFVAKDIVAASMLILQNKDASN